MTSSIRKIIHIDMDCFYAAVEIRDNPKLADKPVAVGGSAEDRSVLCTCNYIARKFKVHSAMPTAYAKRLCPDLIVLPVNMKKYKAVSEIIRAIFFEITDLVEPLSLDEAYLDVTHSNAYQNSATLTAQAIQKKIWEVTQLTASAGVSCNKLLAKIASGWKKPNGLFVIPPKFVDVFIKTVPVKELFGVGKVTEDKLYKLGVKTCEDLQSISLQELIQWFGDKSGQRLFEQCRGMDERAVEPNRIRKSLSVEHTFRMDLILNAENQNQLIQNLFQELKERLQHSHCQTQTIKSQFIKVKLDTFKVLSIERSTPILDIDLFHTLTSELVQRIPGKIRLLGMGVHFSTH